jgi:imidazolonepropionase-like amidohydrolase/Tol biopolymer transport system component
MGRVPRRERHMQELTEFRGSGRPDSASGIGNPAYKTAEEKSNIESRLRSAGLCCNLPDTNTGLFCRPGALPTIKTATARLNEVEVITMITRGAMLRLILIICGATVFTAACALAQDKPSTGKDSAEKKWDVASVQQPSDTIEFDATEGTWITLDVSPDGKNIVFDLLGDIYKMPITGGDAQLISGGLPYEVQPRFSPDGKKILFTSDRGGGDNIWMMNADGTSRAQITKESFRLLNNPSWHPNGQYVVAKKHFTSERSMGAGEMWMYKIPEGGAGVGLTKRKNDQMDANEPIFSPDGKYLYWSEDMSPGQYFEYNKDPNGTIYVIRRLNLKTGEIDDLIRLNGGACRPQISPDGKTMAFVRRVRGKSVLSLFGMQNGEVRQLWDGLNEDQQETWSLFGVYPGYSWTPDGESIVIWAKGKIWQVNVATGTPTQISFRAHVSQVITKAVRVAQKVGGETLPVKVIRWPQVIPAGNEVVFQALGYLYRKPLAGGTQTRITRQIDHYEFAPALSSDGKQIVFVTWCDTSGGTIRVINLDGRNERVLVSQPGHYVSARFSTDGNWVVYHRGGGDGYRGRLWEEEPGIYIVDAGGKTPPRFLTREGREPRFSLDGQRIYLKSNEGEKAALISVDLLGSDRRVHVISQRATDFCLSPDENWLAFEELWQTYVVPYPHVNVPVEIAPDMTNLPVKKLSTDGGTYLSWSFDSKTIHWSLGPEFFGVDRAAVYAGDTVKTVEGAKDSTSVVKPTVSQLGWNEKADIPNTDLYFVGARILPMNDMSVIENGVVHVKGNRIAEVGTREQIKVPSAAKIIDVTGKTLIPGFIDVHAHTGSSNQSVYSQQNWSFLANLAFGVTTTIDPSNYSEMIFAEGELQRQGTLLAPRVYSTGTILYGAEGDFKTVIDKYEDAVSAIKRTAAWGAIVVKSYNQPRREQRQMVIKAGRELGIMVVPEGGSTMNSMMTMLLDGHTTLEHPFPVAPLYDPELRILSRFGTGYTPTLIVGYGGLWGENYWYQHSNVWENQRLARFVPRYVIDPRSIRRTMAPDSEYHHFALARTAADVLHRGGNVELGAHGQLQGLGVHWELWMFQQGGMTNHEALRSATWMGARALGFDGEIGSIQPGLAADLIVIDGDPLTDIRQSENVLYTMINGRLYDSRTLEQLAPERKPLPKGANLERLVEKDVRHSCLGD